jgi:hypothetical protein
VKDFARPEDVGNGRGRLSSYSLNQADGLAGLGIEASQNSDAGLPLELGYDGLRDRLVNRAVENDVPRRTTRAFFA